MVCMTVFRIGLGTRKRIWIISWIVQSVMMNSSGSLNGMKL